MLCCSITSVVPLGFTTLRSLQSLPITATGDLNKLFTALARSTIYVQWAPWHQGIIVVSTRHHTKHCAIQANEPWISKKARLTHRVRFSKQTHCFSGGVAHSLTDCAVCWNPLKGPAFGSKRHGRGWHYLRIEVEKFASQNFVELIVAPLCSCHENLEATGPARNRRKRKPGRHVIYCAK